MRTCFIISLAVALLACSGAAKGQPATSCEADGAKKEAPTAPVRYVVLVDVSDSTPQPLPESLTKVVASTSGSMVVAKGAGAKKDAMFPGWITVVSLGEEGSFSKIADPGKLIRRVGKAGGALVPLPFYLQLATEGTPSEPDGVKKALADVGFDAQTVSGTVVTGKATLTALASVIALDWVVAVEVPGTVMKKTKHQKTKDKKKSKKKAAK